MARNLLRRFLRFWSTPTGQITGAVLVIGLIVLSDYFLP